jgi:hypothetical protein
MKIVIAACAVCVLLALTVPMAPAQTAEVTATPLTDTDIQLMRSDLQATKNTVIADTMKFTDTESTAFWPVYRDYVRDQQKIADERVQVIKDYAQNFDSMTDDKARDMVQRMINVEDQTLNLREDYWPKFMKALGAKRAAKFYQVDNRITLMVNLQLASVIPLIP